MDVRRECLCRVLCQDHDVQLYILLLMRSVSFLLRRTILQITLDLKWVVVDKLKNYLYRAELIVKMGSNPLDYILTSANFNGHRWLTFLAGFHWC